MKDVLYTVLPENVPIPSVIFAIQNFCFFYRVQFSLPYSGNERLLSNPHAMDGHNEG